MPQSNQRGIETLFQWPGTVPRIASLNRTSVGLKQEGGLIVVTGYATPQSNQRGIETRLRPRPDVIVVIASIEPAWD